MNVLVAGGTGFLGSHVTSKLDERGIKYVTVSKQTGVDLRDYDQTIGVFENNSFDIVINCTANVGGIAYGYERPGELFYDNILMFSHLMEAAREFGVDRFVNPISNCTYPGEVDGKFVEEEWWDGPLHESVLAYGFASKAKWVQSWAYKKQYGFESINLIFPNMYGPGDHFEADRSHALGALVMKFVEAERNDDDEVVVWGTGEPVREWLYVGDGAEALVRAINAPSQIEPINIGVGEGISILRLAEIIKETVGFSGEIVLDKSKPDGAPYKVMDTDRMEEVFDWHPATELQDGIGRTVKWYREHR